MTLSWAGGAAQALTVVTTPSTKFYIPPPLYRLMQFISRRDEGEPVFIEIE